MNNKKIPTLIGLVLTLVLVVGVALTTSLTSKVTTFFSQAGSSIVPNSVGVANVTEKGFTVYWTSQTASLGSVSYGKTTALGDGIAVDDRNLTTPNEKYLTHFARVSGLSANTKYYFNVSGREEAPLEITTLPQAPGNPTMEPSFGKINDATGGALSGAVVVLTVTETNKAATLSKSDGSYVLPAVSGATSGQTETINFLYGTETASISCKVGQDRPLPTIKMGDNADCTKTVSEIPKVASSSGTLTINISDRETVTTPLPTISGKAGIGQTVTIVINSETAITASVKADSSGNWTWTPSSSLSPGQHTVTVTVINPDGTTQTVTKTFIVPTTSILPVTSGTPSADIFHLACVNEACVKITGTGSNTCTTNKDCVPAVIVPPVVTTPPPATVTPPPATTTTPPATGALEDTFVLLGVGVLLIGLGFAPEIWRKYTHILS